MAIVTENKFFGLWQGPIDHDASSVINVIYDTTDPDNFAAIGDSVFIQSPTNDGLLPEVNFIGNVPQESLFYGVLVGGDREGIYSNTSATGPKGPDVVALSGETVRVCTHGRCIANIDHDISPININDPLKAQAGGHLILATSGSRVVARSLQELDQGPINTVGFIAVNIQREGILP